MIAPGLVIFDSDGVLVDSEPLANRVFAERLTGLGLPMTVEETMAAFMGRTLEACLSLVESWLGRPVPAGFLADLQRETFAVFERELRAVDGVDVPLDAFEAAGLPTCVASGGGHDKLKVTLGLTGLLPRFEGRIFSATEVARGKPHPDLFLYAADRMGVRPEACVVVEDSVLGVRAAVAAGMACFGYAARTDAGALRAAGAHPFTDLRALPALIAGPWAGPRL